MLQCFFLLPLRTLYFLCKVLSDLAHTYIDLVIRFQCQEALLLHSSLRVQHTYIDLVNGPYRVCSTTPGQRLQQTYRNYINHHVSNDPTKFVVRPQGKGCSRPPATILTNMLAVGQWGYTLSVVIVAYLVAQWIY